jgi:hypothetical protein
MDDKWAAIFNLSPALLRARSDAIDAESHVSGSALRQQLGLKVGPRYQRSDIRDAVSTFLIVFVGAMVFLM